MKLRPLLATALPTVVLAFALSGCATEDTAPVSSMPMIPDVNLSSNDGDGGSESQGRKVLVCHVPPGNPGNAHVIEISARALMAHLAHGDCLAAEGAEKGEPCDCAEEDTPPPPVDF